MPVIEILTYAPLDMAKFLDFCANGKPDGQGDFETDDQGRKIVGVLRWLHGREVSKAHFFNSQPGDAVQLFVAAIERVEGYDVPWMRRIPGFEEMVNADGLIGKRESLGNLSLSGLLGEITPNTDLDKKFLQGTSHVGTLLERVPDAEILPIGRREVLATLRGDIGTDTKAVFLAAERKFGLAL